MIIRMSLFKRDNRVGRSQFHFIFIFNSFFVDFETILSFFRLLLDEEEGGGGGKEGKFEMENITYTNDTVINPVYNQNPFLLSLLINQSIGV